VRYAGSNCLPNSSSGPGNGGTPRPWGFHWAFLKGLGGAVGSASTSGVTAAFTSGVTASTLISGAPKRAVGIAACGATKADRGVLSNIAIVFVRVLGIRKF
jgi:hypothetical protein